MKKFIVVAAALLMGLQANAQLIFNGGYLHETENTVIKENDTEIKGTDVLDGFYLGAKYRIGLDGVAEGLSVAPISLSCSGVITRLMIRISWTMGHG